MVNDCHLNVSPVTILILIRSFIDDLKLLQVVDISFSLLYIATVGKNFKINLEGQNYVHFYVILSRNVKIFGIMASL